MKRSEMLTIMHELISDELCTREEFNLDDCERLLKTMEQAGMLPPPKELENVTARVKYYYPFDEVDEDVTYHTNPQIFWEQE